MKIRDLVFWGGAVGTGMYVYGHLLGRHQLKLERQTIYLSDWPIARNGYKIAVLADFHVRDQPSSDFARRAIDMALRQNPDLVVIVGDFVQSWNLTIPKLLGDALTPLETIKGRVLAVPGNHDYMNGDASLLAPICAQLGIRLMRNEFEILDGIQWVGIDSFSAGKSHAQRAMNDLAADLPTVVLWHEPDAVDLLPKPALLQLSGHSHGGQFVLPGGFTPKRTYMGRKYHAGYYKPKPTPVYVSRGVGTTFLPSRFNCRPEVSLLTLMAGPDILTA